MDDKVYEDFRVDLRKAIREILSEVSMDPQVKTIQFDDLCLAVKAKYKKLEFVAITDEIRRMLKESAIQADNHVYELRLSALEMLADL